MVVRRRPEQGVPQHRPPAGIGNCRQGDHDRDGCRRVHNPPNESLVPHVGKRDESRKNCQESCNLFHDDCEHSDATLELLEGDHQTSRAMTTRKAMNGMRDSSMRMMAIGLNRGARMNFTTASGVRTSDETRPSAMTGTITTPSFANSSPEGP